MSYSKIKYLIRRADQQARSANGIFRAYYRAAHRSITPRQRIGSSRIIAILLSLTFFHFFPILVLTSYMSWSGFFSYDMFSDGISGATAFYWWMEAILIVATFYLTGSLYFITESKLKKGKFLPLKSIYFWISLVVNFLMCFLIFFSNWEKRYDGFEKEQLCYTLLICAWISFHIAIVVNGSGKLAMRSLLGGILLLTTISFIQPGALAFPYSLSLQYFGNGGGILVSVKLPKADQSIHGRLVLQSPEHVYFYEDGHTSISVIANKDIELISIENLSGFGHGKQKSK